MPRPNVIYVFADQWRAQAMGYAGDPNVKTPNLDVFAAESVNFRKAISGVPVCCPARATLISGQRPLSHGVFLNDVCLPNDRRSIAHRFKDAGYDTAYIGKWHIDGHGRKSYNIPPERNRGFDYWKVLECTHDYNSSPYFEGTSEVKKFWEGYDAIAQTTDACNYVRNRSPEDKPFLLMLSWGPPHDPYGTAPEQYRAMYNPDDIILPLNVPEEEVDTARKELAGYYAHCSALDDQFARLREVLRATGQEENTILVFTSDHGDMLRSHGQQRKQRPWEESMRIPFLLRWPAGLGEQGRATDALLDVLDHQPTLLELCSIECDGALEGLSFKAAAKNNAVDADYAALLACYHPFGEYERRNGGQEYRGLRTQRYTYVETRGEPWLLYDNDNDPYQLLNLVSNPTHSDIQHRLSSLLHAKLDSLGDRFEIGETYCRHWGHPIDEWGTVPVFD
ncbi:sulfatase family protein [Cerasicoccus arenae]|uniref:Sulfatase n=1 Tax=Cerasicoccus arenae TaxID=424488 RepID=A0A8J3DBF5_9BACT|nr:sulfatase [Cerasicoccus arenae]MBK1856684.1 sulfatase [Cerasicoccus arenae]GHB98896.1 sulfatase [Cerasicoccus arenae]